MKRTFKILARHKWVTGATITESVDRETGMIRRFTATIRGFQNWRLYEGASYDELNLNAIIDKVKKIRSRIDQGDDSVFDESALISLPGMTP